MGRASRARAWRLLTGRAGAGSHVARFAVIAGGLIHPALRRGLRRSRRRIDVRARPARLRLSAATRRTPRRPRSPAMTLMVALTGGGWLRRTAPLMRVVAREAAEPEACRSAATGYARRDGFPSSRRAGGVGRALRRCEFRFHWHRSSGWYVPGANSGPACMPRVPRAGQEARVHFEGFRCGARTPSRYRAHPGNRSPPPRAAEAAGRAASPWNAVSRQREIEGAGRSRASDRGPACPAGCGSCRCPWAACRSGSSRARRLGLEQDAPDSLAVDPQELAAIDEIGKRIGIAAGLVQPR